MFGIIVYLKITTANIYYVYNIVKIHNSGSVRKIEFTNPKVSNLHYWNDSTFATHLLWYNRGKMCRNEFAFYDKECKESFDSTKRYN